MEEMTSFFVVREDGCADRYYTRFEDIVRSVGKIMGRGIPIRDENGSYSKTDYLSNSLQLEFSCRQTESVHSLHRAISLNDCEFKFEDWDPESLKSDPGRLGLSAMKIQRKWLVLEKKFEK